MAVEDHDRIVRLRMFVEILRHQHMCANEHITTPELGQQLAADAHMPDELRVGLRRNGLDFPIEAQRGALRMQRVDMHTHRRRIKIARLARPLLAFTLVRRQLQHTPVGEVKDFIAVQHRLYQVISRRHLRELAGGPAERPLTHEHRLSRTHGRNVLAEDERAGERLVRVHVLAGLAVEVTAQQQNEPPVQRHRAARERELHRKGRARTHAA